MEVSAILPDEQVVPGFNAFINSSVSISTDVGYCPMNDDSPPDFSTVYIMRSFEQKDSIITFDFAMYIKAKEIQWWQPKELCLGGFHVAINCLSLLGKKYDGSGIEDLFIEDRVYDSRTVIMLLNGKSYSHGIQAHKLIIEAIFRLQWQSFGQWLSQHDDVTFDKIILAERITGKLSWNEEIFKKS